MQSVLLQQSFIEMHELVAGQGRSPFGHWHWPPGAGQTSPVNPQSELEQQVLMGMHIWPSTHATVPAGQSSPHSPFTQT